MRENVVRSGRRYRIRRGVVAVDEYSPRGTSPEGIQPLMATGVSPDEPGALTPKVIC